MPDLIFSLSTLIPVLVGALIAFFSAVGIDCIRDWKESSRNKKLLKASLCQLKDQVAWTLMRLAPATGKLDDKLFDQLSSVITERHGERFVSGDISALETSLQSTAPKDKHAVVQALNTTESGKTIGLKKFHPQFVLSSFSRLHGLSDDCIQGVTEIASIVALINEEIDAYYFCFHQTFDPSKMATNSNELRHNMQSSLEMILLQSRRLLRVVDYTQGELKP